MRNFVRNRICFSERTRSWDLFDVIFGPLWSVGAIYQWWMGDISRERAKILIADNFFSTLPTIGGFFWWTPRFGSWPT